MEVCGRGRGPLQGRIAGIAVILRSPVVLVVAGKALLIALHRHRTKALLPFRLHLIGRWASVQAAASTVETHAIHVVDDHRTVDIRVADDRPVHPHHRGVVAEVPAVPAAAVEAVATVSIAVVHAAVEAYGGSPVSAVPQVSPATPAPVTRRPQQADGRRQHPGSRHPVVPARPPGPVTRCPDVVCRRTDRLLVNGQLGRSHGDGDADGNLREGRTRQRAQDCDQGESAEPAESFHLTCTLPAVLRLPGSNRYSAGFEERLAILHCTCDCTTPASERHAIMSSRVKPDIATRLSRNVLQPLGLPEKDTNS
jgi:hypothetical protein